MAKHEGAYKSKKRRKEILRKKKQEEKRKKRLNKNISSVHNTEKPEPEKDQEI